MALLLQTVRGLFLGVLCACATRPATPLPGAEPPVAARPASVFVAGGRDLPAGTRIVRWDEPGGYSAYRSAYGRGEEPGKKQTDGDVFGTRPGDPQSIGDLREVVHQVVVHYDVCGTSCRCFDVLKRRKLSCHFLLDADGTIYQTLDLKERAWHAGFANDHSIGIEIAQIGAYRDPSRLRGWYGDDGALAFPKSVPLGNLRPAGLKTARPGLIRGPIHGAAFHQRDFTPQQYDALVRLLAGLVRALPRIRPDAPRGADGRVLTTVLGTPKEARAFAGIVGHYHLTRGKIDPGPAFDWERVLDSVRARLEDF